MDAMNNGGIPVIKNRFEHFAEVLSHISFGFSDYSLRLLSSDRR